MWSVCESLSTVPRNVTFVRKMLKKVESHISLSSVACRRLDLLLKLELLIAIDAQTPVLDLLAISVSHVLFAV